MSTEIITLAITRAQCMAKLEELSQAGVPSTDPDERRAFDLARQQAQNNYLGAEERFQRAVSTYSDAELRSILGPNWPGKHPRKRAA